MHVCICFEKLQAFTMMYFLLFTFGWIGWILEFLCLSHTRFCIVHACLNILISKTSTGKFSFSCKVVAKLPYFRGPFSQLHSRRHPFNWKITKKDNSILFFCIKFVLLSQLQSEYYFIFENLRLWPCFPSWHHIYAHVFSFTFL